MAKMKLVFAAACIAAGLGFGGAMEAQAAPVTMPDGTVFDPDYYAQMNPDVVITVGLDPMALYDHYVRYGRKEGRAAVAPQDVVATIDPNAFDAAYYGARYPDVAASFGNDARILQWHYECWGKAEGRFANIAAETLAVQAQSQAQKQAAQEQKTQAQTQQQTAVKSMYIRDVYDLINSERKKGGIDKKMQWSEGLEAAADIRVKEIASYMSHDRLDGSKYYTVVDGANAQKLTEVFGQGQATPQEIVDYWMKDNGNRNNLMNEHFFKIGVGYYTANGTTYWVALLWQNS